MLSLSSNKILDWDVANCLDLPDQSAVADRSNARLLKSSEIFFVRFVQRVKIIPLTSSDFFSSIFYPLATWYKTFSPPNLILVWILTNLLQCDIKFYYFTYEFIKYAMSIFCKDQLFFARSSYKMNTFYIMHAFISCL